MQLNLVIFKKKLNHGDRRVPFAQAPDTSRTLEGLVARNIRGGLMPRAYEFHCFDLFARPAGPARHRRRGDRIREHDFRAEVILSLPLQIVLMLERVGSTAPHYPILQTAALPVGDWT